MSKTNLRWAVMILTVITAGIHLFLGATSLSDPTLRTLSILWLLNVVGYLGLLAAVVGWVSFIPRDTAHYLLIAYAAVTIVAWVVMGSMTDKLAWVTKIDEVLLMVATFLHSRAS